MPVFLSHTDDEFPPVQQADPDGLLAFGGDLSPERLINAYAKGIFPWYESGPVLWWCPDPRFVLFPGELYISRTTKALLKKNSFRFSVNTAFAEVIRHCRNIQRPGQFGTWITDEVEKAYIHLHHLGYAHSAEVWDDDQLAGGLYGIRLGKVFFGESMFSAVSNASKLAFIHYVKQLQAEGVALVDCQVYTAYLESFGARMIPRTRFTRLLERWIPPNQKRVPR